ncbi:hypothetical protein D3C81_1911780 [compost metagenome]
MRLTLIGMRSSGCRVSGRRVAAQIRKAPPNRAKKPKIQRQGATSMISWPTVGARMGTPRKTRKLSDMTRAMVRPA